MVKQALLEEAQSSDVIERSNSMDRIQRNAYFDMTAVWALLQGASDHNEDVQVHALMALREIKCYTALVKGTIEGIVKQEGIPDTVRGAAEKYLADAEKAIGNEHNADPRARAIAMDGLGASESPKPEIDWLLLEGMKDGNTEVRKRALLAVRERKNYNVYLVAEAGKLAQDPNQHADVRNNAELFIEEAGRGMEQQLRELRANGSKNVKITALKKLADGGYMKAAGQIEVQTRANDKDLRDEARVALKRLEDLSQEKNIASFAAKKMESGLKAGDIASTPKSRNVGA